MAQGLGTEDAQAVKAEAVLWSFVADPKTLVFREVNVLAVEKALREVATIRSVGGGLTYYDHVEYRIACYEIGERAYAAGVFFIELLLKAKDGDITNPEKLMVVNARVSFISKAGSCYENYLAPNDWPVTKIRGDQRANPEPRASAEEGVVKASR